MVPHNGVKLAPLPAPDCLELTLPEGHICLLTDDGGPTAPALAGLLARQGWRVALLCFPADVVPAVTERALPAGVARVPLPALAEADLEAALAEIAAQHGPVGAFIHLHPALPDAALFDARERALVKAVFLLAKHLHPALIGAAEQGHAAWLTVTRLDGALGFTGAESASALAGGLAGLTKSLRLEWAQAANPVFCRALDLAPALAPEQAAQAIWAELHDPDRRLAEVGIGEGGRVTPILDCGFSILEDTPTYSNFHPSSLFLVSGGAKGITAQCVIAAARRYGGTYLLLGSSPAGPEPDWCAGIADEAALKQRAMEQLAAAGERPTPKSVARMARAALSQREIAATLRAIEAAGGRAVYIRADVTDAQAVRSGVEAALRELAGAADALPRITGIIHGAGVIADKPIHQKTADDFEWVYGVKVDGLQNLLACVPPGQLEHLILFSSVAGFYGNVGQADYALANEVLNKLAHRLQREHPACRVRALDWGPWDGGMVTPELKRLLAQRHVEVIPPAAGTEIFVRALAEEAPAVNAGDAVQQVVGGALVAPATQPQAELQTYRLHRRLTLEANPFLRDHVIGGQAVLPTVCAVAWVANAAEQLYPGYTFFRADDYRALKGIVFDETLAADYTLELRETAAAPEEIAFEALIQSATAEGKPRFHYRVNVTLRRELPAPPRFDRMNLDATRALDGATLYTDGTLFHGPAFRGVERVLNLGPAGLTMRCRLPQVAPETQGQFPVQNFNPYLTDVELQSLLIWAKQTYGYGGLPLKIQGGAQYRPVAFGETIYVSLAVQASSERQLVADVTVYDTDGLLYSRVEGAEITLSPRLNDLFAQNRLEARI